MSFMHRLFCLLTVGTLAQGCLLARFIPAVLLRQPEHTVYGFAVLPVGFFTEFAPRRRWHPVAEVAGGLVASTEPIPIRGTNATGSISCSTSEEA
ncbi:MAG: hypothetical protein ABI995_16890 [Acidobacteriota bacterium]